MAGSTVERLFEVASTFSRNFCAYQLCAFLQKSIVYLEEKSLAKALRQILPQPATFKKGISRALLACGMEGKMPLSFSALRNQSAS
ncbi:hypothetical protein [Pararhizobium sp.]|uniref:hypothetical protein n=1 Tax=Pararhizobium sp. TaxID=1977563 RepID=UPI00271D3D91|nr:hypothetical protein [Pararhizobium sp.]MDO9417826.1 hypothetical protein [Pararhizobium sp.]